MSPAESPFGLLDNFVRCAEMLCENELCLGYIRKVTAVGRVFQR